MAITKAPRRTSTASTVDERERERRAEAWIAEGGSTPAADKPAPKRQKEPVNMKVDADFLERIDADVKRRGTNRTHWILDACAEKLARSE
jgi:hypothetical protein